MRVQSLAKGDADRDQGAGRRWYACLEAALRGDALSVPLRAVTVGHDLSHDAKGVRPRLRLLVLGEVQEDGRVHERLEALKPARSALLVRLCESR